MRVQISMLALVVSLMFAHSAHADDGSNKVQESKVQQSPRATGVASDPSTDREITASPQISKAEVRALEKAKEKDAVRKQPMSERALMMMKGAMSY